MRDARVDGQLSFLNDSVEIRSVFVLNIANGLADAGEKSDKFLPRVLIPISRYQGIDLVVQLVDVGEPVCLGCRHRCRDDGEENGAKLGPPQARRVPIYMHAPGR